MELKLLTTNQKGNNMTKSAAPPLSSAMAATPNAVQPLACEEDATTSIIAAPTYRGITCLLNFDLDHWSARSFVPDSLLV
jgi:hypothetical protein